MKTYFFGDTETSGKHPSDGSQILELALIAKSESGSELGRLEVKLQVKPNAKINEEALKVNNINPYSPDWLRQSVRYDQGFKLLHQFVNDLKKNESLFLAYNLPFDRNYLDSMAKEHNHSFDALFQIGLDPLLVAKKITKLGLIETPLKPSLYPNGQPYRSNSLQDVSTALNTKSSGDAHSAMPDVETLVSTTEAMSLLLYKKPFYHLTTELSDFMPVKK